MRLPLCARCNQRRTPSDLVGGKCVACRAAKPICSVLTCTNPVKARGMCENHYRAWRTHGDPFHTREDKPPVRCSAQPCDRFARAGGMCDTHYRQLRSAGMTWPIEKAPRGRIARPTPAEVVIEVELLIGTDTVDSITSRLGYTDRNGLYKALRSANRDDLADRLAAHHRADYEAMRESQNGAILGPRKRREVA